MSHTSPAGARPPDDTQLVQDALDAARGLPCPNRKAPGCWCTACRATRALDAFARLELHAVENLAAGLKLNAELGQAKRDLEAAHARAEAWKGRALKAQARVDQLGAGNRPRAGVLLVVTRAAAAPAPASMAIEPGDIVRHGPTGETWLVRRVDGEHLEPAGWPPSRARVADCVVVEKGAGAELLRRVDERKAAAPAQPPRRDHGPEGTAGVPQAGQGRCVACRGTLAAVTVMVAGELARLCAECHQDWSASGESERFELMDADDTRRVAFTDWANRRRLERLNLPRTPRAEVPS